MATIEVRDRSGQQVGTVEADDAVFGVQPNISVMHQVVTAQLAARRRGTHATRSRAEVSGGGRKPWRQKGTGRARQGSTRAPHWTGGGVAMGPTPRSYRQRTPKKMVRLALCSALSDRFRAGRVLVVDSWDFEEPKTRHGAAALSALGVSGRVLVVVRDDDERAVRALRNLPSVHLVLDRELNTYDVLVSDWVIFTRATLPTAAADPAAAGAPTAGEEGA
jgi:large subunit ribosomal protein L4